MTGTADPPVLDVVLRKRLGAFALDVAFRGERGVTALFGRSGSGRSTVLALIAGLLRPDGGHVRLEHARLEHARLEHARLEHARLDDARLDDTTLVDAERGLFVPSHRRRIGLVFQDAQLFPHMSVRANLTFGRWFAGRRAGAAFDPVVDTLGLGPLLGRAPRSLSGGERQRVAIGRALLAAPRLLLFDEPLASLDRERRLDILPLIERVRDEFAVPIVYVSHAAEEVVRLAAHVVMLEGGRVAAAGPPDAVLGSAAVADRRFGRVSVLVASVGERDEDFGLVALDHPAGRLWLAGQTSSAGQASARRCPAGARVRLAIHADDVGLAPGDPGPLSIRSRLRGRIAAIEDEGALAAVTLALEGGGTLLALVTRRALHDLALTVGSPATALVKTVALDEGSLPGPSGGAP